MDIRTHELIEIVQEINRRYRAEIEKLKNEHLFEITVLRDAKDTAQTEVADLRQELREALTRNVKKKNKS